MLLLRERCCNRNVARRNRDFDFAQERIVTEDRVDERCGWPIVEDAIATANHHLVSIERRVGETDAWGEVVYVLATQRVIVSGASRGCDSAINVG